VVDGDYEHEIVDGQQRLRAIWDFCENKFPLAESSNDIPEMPNIGGKVYKELSSSEQDKIGLFSLSLVEIRDVTETEIRELFLRLQEGKALNPAEKRNAMEGNMRDFIAEEICEHNVFSRVNINSPRFEFHDWAAHVACLELNGGPADLKAVDLKKMYENEVELNTKRPAAKKIKRVLNCLKKVLEDSPPEMSIKLGFTDLYLLISDTIEEYDVKDRHNDFCGFYIAFEQERREVDDPADLLEDGGPWARDLYDYIEAFQREGAKRDNIETRRSVYRKRFMNNFPNIVPKDSQRLFNPDERLIIWRRAGMKCQSQACGKFVELDEMHADHIVSHSAGGKTTIENGQCLCADCNLAKSDGNLGV
jgi:hypothetical protein